MKLGTDRVVGGEGRASDPDRPDNRPVGAPGRKLLVGLRRLQALHAQRREPRAALDRPWRERACGALKRGLQRSTRVGGGQAAADLDVAASLDHRAAGMKLQPDPVDAVWRWRDGQLAVAAAGL